MTRPPSRRRAASTSRCLEEGDGQRVDLFAARATRNPDADGAFTGSLAEHGRDGLARQYLEDRGIAEERGDADQDVCIEGVELLRGVRQQPHVVGERVDLQRGHASADAPLDGGRLVVREVDVARGVEELEQSDQIALRQRGRTSARLQRRGSLSDARQFLANVGGIEDVWIADWAGRFRRRIRCALLRRGRRGVLRGARVVTGRRFRVGMFACGKPL